MTTSTFTEKNNFLKTSAVLNYLSQIFCLNTAATFTVQATGYRLALYFTMQR